jgi:hypothetical protein
LEDEEIIKDTITQIYQLSRMYWKSVDQQNIPITVKYPENDCRDSSILPG